MTAALAAELLWSHPAVSTALPTAEALAPDRRHFFWIDWLRFLAAFFVLLDHACQGNWAGPNLVAAPEDQFLLRLMSASIHLGRESVVVFFVLSGALVGGLTLEKWRAGTFDARAYAADRLARVYVPLVPAVLLSVALVRVFDFPLYPERFVGSLFGLQGWMTFHPRNNSPLWSLAYEMWFYLLAGCAAVAATRRKHSPGAWLAAWVGVGLALGVLCIALDWINLVCWLVGAVGFGLRHRLTEKMRPWLGVTGGLLMLAGGARFRQDWLAQIPALANVRQWPWVVPLAHLTLSVGTLLLAVSVCRSAPRTRAGAWLEHTGTRLAAFSYTLYLTHFPIITALVWTTGQWPEVVTWPSLFRLGAWMAGCVAAAVILYVLFERQTPRVRRWLRARFAPSERGLPVPGGERLVPAR